MSSGSLVLLCTIKGSHGLRPKNLNYNKIENHERTSERERSTVIRVPGSATPLTRVLVLRAFEYTCGVEPLSAAYGMRGPQIKILPAGVEEKDLPPRKIWPMAHGPPSDLRPSEILKHTLSTTEWWEVTRI